MSVLTDTCALAQAGGETIMDGNTKMRLLEKETDSLIEQLKTEVDKSVETPGESQASSDGNQAPDAIKKESVSESDKGPGVSEEKHEEPWKQRYLTLQSKYDAEVPRYASEKRDLKEENKDLSRKLSQLQEKFSLLEDKINQRTDAAKNDDEIASLKKMLEGEIGSSAVDGIEKYIDIKTRNSSGGRVDSIENKVKTIESKLAGTQERQVLGERQQYIKDLKSRIPDIVSKNNNPEWKLWLNNIAPFSRSKTYQELLDEASSSYDADAVVEIFSACPVFKNNGQKKETPVIEPSITKQSKVSDIESKRIYSQSEVDKFYSDAARGKYAGDKKYYEKMDAEYFLANAEGRIR